MLAIVGYKNAAGEFCPIYDYYTGIPYLLNVRIAKDGSRFFIPKTESINTSVLYRAAYSENNAYPGTAFARLEVVFHEILPFERG